MSLLRLSSNFRNGFDDGRDFLSRLEELRNNILEEDSLTARLNLVKFFLGHQMTKEALSYLEYIGDYDQSYHNNDNLNPYMLRPFTLLKTITMP